MIVLLHDTGDEPAFVKHEVIDTHWSPLLPLFSVLGLGFLLGTFPPVAVVLVPGNGVTQPLIEIDVFRLPAELTT